MPQPLKFLSLTLVALLIADIAMLAVDSVTTLDSDPSTRSVIVGVNLATIAITFLLLALLFAYAKRVRHSTAWLQTFVIVNAVVLTAGSLLLDHSVQTPSLLEALKVVRSWAEALVCTALALSLRRHESESWFARSDLQYV